MKHRYPILFLLLCGAILNAGDPMPTIEADAAWLAKIEDLAPVTPQVAPKKKRTVLVFSLMTGFKHWCTPHTTGIIKILGEKSSAYEVVVSDDVANFEPEKIKKYDVIVLNNTCSLNPDRHLFFDALQDREKADKLEKSLLRHIRSGHGLVAVHGGIVMLNNSAEFSEMLGGSFDFHPKQQAVTGHLVDPDHPITSAFKGKPLVHYDEPYIFKNAYAQLNFHPLLEMEIGPDEETRTDKRLIKNLADGPTRYISWIKRYGKGRVFYCSPSHNAQSFEQPELLQFILNGVQYAAGDLDCDDTPLREQ